MLKELIPDIRRMTDLSKEIGQLIVEYRLACEIKRGIMPDEKKLAAMRKKESELRQELRFLSEKWGIEERKY